MHEFMSYQMLKENTRQVYIRPKQLKIINDNQ